MTRLPISVFLLLLIVCPALALSNAGLTKVELTLVDANATGYGTFQSHNQKIVSNENGIFMTHLRSHNENYTAQQWRLSQSTDGGLTFNTIFEATDPTYPPVLETDENNNIYLVRTDFVNGHAFFYRFLADENYAQPHITTILKGSAQKFCMVYDQPRQQFYYMTWEGGFYIIPMNSSGMFHARRKKLLANGDYAVPMYPHLFLDVNGNLHYAWTTQKYGVYLYWDIHYMMSPDVGEHWQKLDGSPLAIPVKCDNSGASDRITLSDEFDVHTWLSNMMIKDGKIHFLYEAQFNPHRQHYVRYDMATASRDVDIMPRFGGEQIYLAGLDGFFTTKPGLENAPLYCIGRFAGRIGCLASDDNGETWYDYAAADSTFNLYSIGGCRIITQDNYIIGSFTNYQVSGEGEDQSQVYFLRIKAGLAQAKVARANYRNGRLTVEFSNVHGQPETIRFATASDEWGEWMSFAGKMQVELSAMPVKYQLRSRMKVESDVFEIDYTTAVKERGIEKNGNMNIAVCAYPNPFNAETVIEISLPDDQHVAVAVFDINGRLVRTLTDGQLARGTHYLKWNGRDSTGKAVASGIYLCRIQGHGAVQSQKIILQR